MPKNKPRHYGFAGCLACLLVSLPSLCGIDLPSTCSLQKNVNSPPLVKREEGALKSYVPYVVDLHNSSGFLKASKTTFLKIIWRNATLSLNYNLFHWVKDVVLGSPMIEQCQALFALPYQEQT